MRNDIFIDTSGFYSLMVRNDEKHEVAKGIVDNSSKGKYLFATSDYVVDETVTLIKARKFAFVVPDFLKLIHSTRICRMEWTNSELFEDASRFCIKHLDKDYSFTDCMIMTIMKERGINRILTKDEHFKTAGFDALLT